MSSRERPAALLLLASIVLAACTTTGTVTSTPSSLGWKQGNPSNPYVINDLVRRTVDMAYVDRYVCVNDRPLTCRCTSRIALTCDCACGEW
jgi:hypothetical protein